MMSDYNVKHFVRGEVANIKLDMEEIQQMLSLNK